MAASISYQAAGSQGGGGPYSIGLSVASAAGQERLVALMGIANGSIGDVAFTSVAIGGQSATQVGSYVRIYDGTGGGAGNGIVLSFWRAAGTSSTSINVTCSAPSGLFDARCALWTLNDTDTLLDTGSEAEGQSAITGSLQGDLDTVAGGVVAAVAMAYNSSTHTATWSGLTERFDGGGLYGNDWYTAADLNVGSGSTPLSVTVNFASLSVGNGNCSAVLAVSFNPVAGGTTLTADAGAYTITGASAGLAGKAVAAAGSYVLTGSAAAFAYKQPAAAGSYALTGTAAAFLTATTLTAAGGSYTLTGSDATFQVGGSFTLFCGSGSYTLTGSDATFPGYDVLPPQPQPSPGGGYTGAWSGPKRRKRKRDEIEELIDAVIQAPPQIPPQTPQIPQPPPPALIDMTAKMQAVGLTPPQRRTVKRAIVSDDEDDDEEAIELLLNLLS